MTKSEITNSLIEAGLDRFLVGSFWQGNDCFVGGDDLDRCKPSAITALVKTAAPLVTDKGLVFQAR